MSCFTFISSVEIMTPTLAGPNAASWHQNNWPTQSHVRTCQLLRCWHEMRAAYGSFCVNAKPWPSPYPLKSFSGVLDWSGCIMASVTTFVLLWSPLRRLHWKAGIYGQASVSPNNRHQSERPLVHSSLNGLHFSKKIYSLSYFYLSSMASALTTLCSIFINFHSVSSPSLVVPHFHFILFQHLKHSKSFPSLPLSSRLNAGHEQNTTGYGEGRHPFHQRLLHHTHVLPVPLLHPHRQVRAQPPHVHQQWELLVALLAGPPRATHVCCAPQQLWLQNRWAKTLGNNWIYASKHGITIWFSHFLFISLFWKISEWIQWLLCAPWLEGMGGTGEELPLLQLHPLSQWRPREAQRRLRKGIKI